MRHARRVGIAAVFCPNFSTPTVFAVDTIREITQHCEAVGEKLEERLGLGRREERNEEGKKEATFCLRSKGMAKGGEEMRGEERKWAQTAFLV